MTSEVTAWCTRFDACAWRVGRGEHALVAELATLSDRAVELARTGSASERNVLMGRLARAAEIVAQAQADVSTRLEELPARRRAARRYVATPRLHARDR